MGFERLNRQLAYPPPAPPFQGGESDPPFAARFLPPRRTFPSFQRKLGSHRVAPVSSPVGYLSFRWDDTSGFDGTGRD